MEPEPNDAASGEDPRSDEGFRSPEGSYQHKIAKKLGLFWDGPCARVNSEIE